MAIVGVASVKIKPDLSDFRKELKAGLDAIKAEIKVNVKADTDPARREIEAFVARQELKDITKKLDIDRSSIDRAQKALSSVAKSLFDVGQGLTNGILKFAKITAIAITAAAAISGITTVVGGLAHGLAELAPAGLATGLGGLLTLATVVGTIKLGLGGIGRAMDALNGPVQNLKKSVENSFQGAFVPAVNNLKTVIPQLKTPLQEVATAIGGAATKFTAMLKTGENMSLVRSIIENSAKAVQGLGSALAPLGHAFLEVGSVATKIFAAMTRGLGQVAQEFADKITLKAQSGALEQSFRNSIEAVHQLFNAIRDFGAGVGNIFRALSGSISSGSGSLLETLAQIAAKFREFTAMDSTKQFFSTVGDVIHILTGAFLSLLQAIQPVLPILADTAKVIAEGLSGVIKDLAPLIADVAKHFLEIVQKVAPKLMPIIEKLAGAFLKILDACLPLIDPLVDLVNALLPLVDPIVRLVQDLVPPLVGLLKALTPIVGDLAKALGGLSDALGPVVGGLLELAGIGLGGITDLLGITDGNQLTATFKKNLPNLLKTAAEGGKNAGHLLGTNFGAEAQETMDRGVNAIKRLLGDSGPDLEAISKSLGDGAATAMGHGFEEVNDEMLRILNDVLSSLGLQIPSFSSQGAAISKALGDGVSSQEQEILDTIDRIANNILATLSGHRPKVQQEGTSIGQSLAQGVAQSDPTVSAAATGVAAVLIGAFSPVSLFSVGQRIGNSLADGIRSAINAVKAVLTALTIGIPLWKGPPAVDKVLLKPTGVWIMQGLITGITSQQDELQRVLGTVTDQFSSATNPSSLVSSLNSSFALSSDLSQPTVNVNVGLNEGALKGVIDVQIDEGNRQTRRVALTGGTFG